MPKNSTTPSSIRRWSAFLSYHAFPARNDAFRTLKSPLKRDRISSSCRKRAMYPTSYLKPDERRLGRERSSGHSHTEQTTLILGFDFASTLVLIATAAAGGRALCVCGLCFLLLRKYTMSPLWLQVTSTFLCASIADALGQNWAGLTLDSGIFPFLVFFAGSGATALLKAAYLSQPLGALTFDSTQRTSTFESKDARHTDLELFDNIAGKPDTELAQWDQAFNETNVDIDT